VADNDRQNPNEPLDGKPYKDGKIDDSPAAIDSMFAGVERLQQLTGRQGPINAELNPGIPKAHSRNATAVALANDENVVKMITGDSSSLAQKFRDSHIINKAFLGVGVIQTASGIKDLLTINKKSRDPLTHEVIPQARRQVFTGAMIKIGIGGLTTVASLASMGIKPADLGIGSKLGGPSV
jgi:hypothetical protein